MLPLKKLPLSLPFFILSVVIPQVLSAQTNPYGEVSISSPTAASLGKYADIPVTYNTGTPQISVPIYTVKEGPLTLPVSLSYHASGLKVMEPAGWVGAGWALNAGGVITRTVMGGPDERGTNVSLLEEKGHFSDYGYNSYFYIAGTSRQQQDWKGFADTRKDGEPDIFFFNFGSYSGKFYFKDDRTPVLVPQQDFKIIPDYPETGNIKSFTIITPDGTKYFFGNSAGLTGVAPIETTNTSSVKTGYQSGSVISSWFLNKIQSADNIFSITLSYAQENYGVCTLSMYPINSTNQSGELTSDYHEYNIVKNIISGVRLSQITFSNGNITFNAGTVRTDLSDTYAALLPAAENVNQEAKTLGSVQITNGSSLCKKFVFYYNYFTDNSTALPTDLTMAGYNIQSDKKRLRLDSVQEVSCDNSAKIPPYKFTYFSEGVPRRINFGQDHWGFSNGVTTNQTLIPTYQVYDGTNTTNVAGADRESAWPAMRGGSLQKITYPTGGYSLFEFEPHDTYLSDYSQTNLNTVLSLYVHLYGQSTYTQTLSLPGSGSFDVSLSNTSSYAGTLTIKNAANVTVQSWPVVENSSTQFTISLPADTYTATLSIPTAVTSGGAQATFKQWQTTVSQVNKMVGGIRIKTITHNDGASGIDQVTNYTYLSGTQSTGILYSRPTYVQIIRNDIIKDVGYYLNTGSGWEFQKDVCSVNGCTSCGWASYYKSPCSIRPMSTMQGNHIGYSQVKVSQSGNGYSLYKYFGPQPWELHYSDVSTKYVNTQGCNTSAPNFPAAPPPIDYFSGELKSEEHFNDAGQLLKDAYYQPVFDTYNAITTPAFMVTSVLGAPYKLLATYYDVKTYRKVQTTTISTAYSPGVGAITDSTITYYNSAFHNEPGRVVKYASTGDSILSVYKYAFDFRSAAADAVSDCSQAYQTDCATCYSTYQTTLAACSTTTCTSNALLDYWYCTTGARINYVSCRKTNFTNSTNAYQTAHNTSKTSADATLKPVYEMQDQFQNPVLESTQWINNKLTAATLNNYAFATSPATAVYPSKSQQISLAAPSASFTTSAVSSNTITKDSRYADEASAVYANGVPLQVKAKNSSPLSYLWAYNGQYPVAKAVNAKSGEIYYESFEEPGGWDASLTAFDSSRSHTGKYAGKITRLTLGELYSRSTRPITVALTAPTKFRYSGWVYSDGPSALIYFFMKRAGETGYYTYLDFNSTTTTNKWVYIEKEFLVPADAVTLDLRIDNSSGGGTVWFDDLRIQPSASIMNTYTYDRLVGMTSETDQNIHTKYYEYDKLGRLQTIRDQDRNIIKRLCYNYAGQVSDCGVLITPPPPPPSVTITSSNPSSLSGYTAVYTNTSSGQQYSFTIPVAGGSLGTVPAGTYNITITKPGNTISLWCSMCSSAKQGSGTTVTFSNISVTTASCNDLLIDTLM